MTLTVTELIERVSTQPPNTEVVAVTDEYGVATLMFRNATTGLLNSPVETYLEHIETRSFHGDIGPLGIPVLKDGDTEVDGAPTRAVIRINIESPAGGTDARQTVTLSDIAPASSQLRGIIRGIADQVAKRAGERIEEIPEAKVEVER